MLLRDWLKAENWKLSQQIWLAIIVTFVSYFVFITTTWWSLIVCCWLLAMFSYVVFFAPPIESRPPLSVWLIVWPCPPWATTSLAITVYIAMSTQWSADPPTTMFTAILMGALLIGSLVGVYLIKHCGTPSRRVYLEHITRTILVSFVLAVMFLLIEQLNGDVIKKTLFWPFKAFKASKLSFDRSTVVEISQDSIKWRMPAVNFTVWTVMFIVGIHIKSIRHAHTVQAVILALVASLIWVSLHGASRAGLIAALVVFPLAVYRPTATRRSLAALWIVAFVAVIPASLAAYRVDAHKDPRLKSSLNARFIIWAYTAEHIKEHPVIGIGAGAAARVNNKLLASGTVKSPDLHYPWAPGPHAHNIYLQSWYELGALGTALVGALGLVLLLLTTAAPMRAQPYMLASFATVSVTASASFGLFEPWFMGALAICAMSAVIAVAYARSCGAPSDRRDP
jgi:O-antigen ligase